MVLLVASLLACEDRLDLVRPAPADSGGGGGGTFQRVSLRVVVAAAGEGAEVGEALGWIPGRVPGAGVSIRRSGESVSVSASSDSLGGATFAQLLPGEYSISVFRGLTPAEITRLAERAGRFSDVSALGGGSLARLSAAVESVTVQAVPGRRGSLVISELFHAAPLSGITFYNTGQYIEFYNNADTTIYMDGKVLARALWNNFERAAGQPWCSLLERWRTDPLGIWSNTYVRFPGGGRDYPVGPGQPVLVVMDAIDHRSYAPGMHDLSGADFEYVGSVDVDNPAVPNLLDVGPKKWVNVVGEGLFFSVVNDVLVLADALDPGELIVENLPVAQDPEYHLIPAAKVLDVLALASTPEAAASMTSRYCARFVHESFDRQYASLLDDALLTGIRRRVFATPPDGRVILQRTRTSAADFFRGTATPGRVP